MDNHTTYHTDNHTTYHTDNHTDNHILAFQNSTFKDLWAPPKSCGINLKVAILIRVRP